MKYYIINNIIFLKYYNNKDIRGNNKYSFIKYNIKLW